MKVKYVNNKEDNRLYNIFLEVLKLEYKEYEIDNIDKIIVKDTIELIDRINMRGCKRFLGRIGIKGYSDLNRHDTIDLLKREIHNQKEEIVLEFYKENKVKFDMFKYEVCEVLNISKWNFDKIKSTLKVSGTQVVNVGCKPKVVKKYDRRFVYEIKLEKEK